jgi:hypothetical protein
MRFTQTAREVALARSIATADRAYWGTRHFVSAIQLDCPDDNAAIESAKQFINGHDIELWQGDRKIAKLDRKRE